MTTPDQPTAPATPRTIEQAAQECAEKIYGLLFSSLKRVDTEDCKTIIAAAMREVVERELSSAQAELAEAKREAAAQGEHAVAMTELAQSLQAALAEAKAEVARLKEDYLKAQSLAAAMLAKSNDELTALRAEVLELKRLLGEVYHNTNLRHHPELTGLADIVSKQLNT